MIAHIVGPPHLLTVVIGGLLLTFRTGEVEQHYIDILTVADDIETMFIGGLYQIVVAIDKLQIASSCHLDTRVTGDADTTMLLTHVDDLVAISHQVVDRTEVRAVIHHDDLTFIGTQRECQHAVDALAQQIHGQVVIGDDETHQRSQFLLLTIHTPAKLQNNLEIRKKFCNFALEN